jgi:hypothetical protein
MQKQSNYGVTAVALLSLTQDGHLGATQLTAEPSPTKTFFVLHKSCEERVYADMRRTAPAGLGVKARSRLTTTHELHYAFVAGTSES